MTKNYFSVIAFTHEAFQEVAQLDKRYFTEYDAIQMAKQLEGMPGTPLDDPYYQVIDTETGDTVYDGYEEEMAALDEPDYEDELNFDPYIGCYTYDC